MRFFRTEKLHKNKSIRLMALLLAMVLVLCGCSTKTGGGKEDAKPNTNPGEVSPKPGNTSQDSKFDEAKAKENLAGLWLLCGISYGKEDLSIIDPDSTEKYLEIVEDGGKLSGFLSQGDFYLVFDEVYLSSDELLHKDFKGENWCAYLISDDLASQESYTLALTDRHSIELMYLNLDKTSSSWYEVHMEFVKRGDIDSWKKAYFAETAANPAGSYWVGSENPEELYLNADGSVHYHLEIYEEEFEEQYLYHDYYDCQWTAEGDQLRIFGEYSDDKFTISPDGQTLTPNEENQTCLSPLTRSLAKEAPDLSTVLAQLHKDWVLYSSLIEGDLEYYDAGEELVTVHIDYDGYGYSFVIQDQDIELSFIPLIEEGPAYEGFLNEYWHGELATEEVMTDEYVFGIQPDGKMCVVHYFEYDGMDFVAYMTFTEK